MKTAVDGLVLREMQSGDHDRRLLVLTNDGKIWVSAKGARSVRSKYAAISQLFSYANLEIYKKGNGMWLSGGSLNKSFFDLGTDLVGFTLASYVCQIADEITGESYPAEEVLRTTLNTLYAIEKRLKPYGQIKATYELFAASVSGYTPDLEHCSHCKRSAFSPSEALWLDVMNGSIICGECQSKKNGELPLPETDRFETRNLLLPLDCSALEAMRYVMRAEPQRLFAFGLADKKSLALFYRAAESFLLNHLERDFDTLHFYNSIKG